MSPSGEPVHAGATVSLIVQTRSGESVAEATVHVVGAGERRTDAAGIVAFKGLSAGRFLARVEAEGYAPGGVAFDLASDARIEARVTLLEHVEQPPFDAEVGGLVDTDTVRVLVPPGALYDPAAPDKVLTGPVVPTIAPLDPTTDLEGLPGPLRGRGTGRGDVLLESLFMADISFWQDGRPLQLRDGTTAHVALRLPDRLARTYRPGDRAPAWSYSFAEGAWLAEPGVTGEIRSALGDGTLWWHADLPHFTWWNADVPVDEISCVTVHVTTKIDNVEVPVAGGFVSLVGKNYNGADTAVTDPQGFACLEMPRTCEVNKVAQSCQAELYFGTLNDPYHVKYPDPIESMQVAGTCDGDCQDVPFFLADAENDLCKPLEKVACGPYNGPPNTENKGTCHGPQKTCNADGTAFGECEPALIPEAWDCVIEPDGPKEDVDCDGVQPEGEPGCTCVDNTDCYTGPPGTAGVGNCLPGKRICDLQTHTYVDKCEGEVLPDTEWKDPNNEDEDCDGLVNENDDPFAQAVDAGHDGNQVAMDLATAGGKLYLVGYFTHGIDFGPNCAIMTGIDQKDVFLARFAAATLECEAIRRIDTGVDSIQPDVRVAIGTQGEVWVLGQCDGAVTADPLTDDCGAENHSFVARYSADLDPLALKALDIVASDLVAAPQSAYVVRTGNAESLRIVKVDLAVDVVETSDVPLLTAGDLTARRVERLGADLVVAGIYHGEPANDPSDLSPGDGVFVVRVAPPAPPTCQLFMPAPEGTARARIEALSLNPVTQQAFLGGGLAGSIHVPPDLDIVLQMPRAAVLAQVDVHAMACKTDWLEAFEASGAVAELRGVAQAPGGHIYAAGLFSGTITVAGAAWAAPDLGEQAADMLFVQRHADGFVAWSAAYGSSSFEAVNALAVFGMSVHVAGQFGADMQLGAKPLDNQGLADAFIASFLPF